MNLNGGAGLWQRRYMTIHGNVIYEKLNETKDLKIRSFLKRYFW